MKRQVILLGMLAWSVTARGDGIPLSEFAMTPIDTLPNTHYLDTVFGDQTLANLQTLGLDTSGSIDLGVQLRAIRTLVTYCPVAAPCGVGTITHDTLAQIIDGYGPGTAVPRDILRLRAAIEALGIAGRSAALDADVTRIDQFLNHPTRDIRATTAKALGNLCNTKAIVPLRVRLQNEQIPQVQLAISAALRDLGTGQCPH